MGIEMASRIRKTIIETMSEQGLLMQMTAMKKMMMCSDGLSMTTTIKQTLAHYNMRLTLMLNETES
jgi:hypothetical protein